jgi:spermidine synthase
MRPSRHLGFLGLASFLSGLAAVAFELVWIRRLGDLFGHAVLSIQVVLAVFFLGLGIGAWIGGRLADRFRGTILLYVLLEATIAICGLLFLPACDLLERGWFAMSPSEWPLARSLAVKGVASALLLAVPTIAMGATLPALTRHVVSRSAQLSSRLGWLYGTNTLGAAVAALAVVVTLLPEVGMAAAVWWIAGANLAAIGAVLLGRIPAGGESPSREEVAPEVAEEQRAAPASSLPRDRWILLGAAAVSGFVAVGLEVSWTRALASRFLNTVYSFAVILAAFLLALGIGALVSGLLGRFHLIRRRTLALSMIGSGFAALLSVAMLARVPELVAATGLGWVALERREMFFALLVMSPALLLFGINLPLVVHLAHREVKTVGRELGGVWLANTCGSVVAPIAIGFLVLPAIGIKGTIVALAWCVLLFGALVVAPWAGSDLLRRARWRLVILAAAATFFLPDDLRRWRSSEGDLLVHYQEGLMASVAVVDQPDGDRILKLNHDYELGTRRTRFAQARQGCIPWLLHEDPKSALMIGLGTGSSAGAVARHSPERLDIVEIVPELGAILPWFEAANGGLARRLESDPSIRLFTTDARAFVRSSERSWDVIVGDLFVPWRAGEGAMYTREHFAAVRDRLEEGGLFCQWLPLYQLRDEELRSITATFLEVFPTTWMWWLYFNVEQPVVGLVGFADEREFDLERLYERIADPAIAEILARDGLGDAGLLAGSWIAEREILAAWVGDAPVETETRPRIEFLAPRRHFSAEGSAAGENLPEILSLVTPVPSMGITAEPPSRLLAETQKYQRALVCLFRALHSRRWEGDSQIALDQLVEGVGIAPRWGWLAENLEQVALELLETGEPEDRAALLRGIRRLETTSDTAFLGRYLAALLAVREGERERARVLLEMALEENPTHAASRRLLESL